MGEIADMMLDGTLCEGCGEFIGEGDGFPGYCSATCAAGRGMAYTPPAKRKSAAQKRHERTNAARARAAGRRFECPECGRGCRSPEAIQQHIRDKHSNKGKDQ